MEKIILLNKIAFLRKNPYILLILCAFIILIASLGIPLKDFVGGCGSDDSSEDAAADMAERDEIERIMSSETQSEAEKLEAIKGLIASGATSCSEAQRVVPEGFEAIEVTDGEGGVRVRAGGKEYLFVNNPFPSVTLSDGRPLFTQIPKLNVIMNGKSVETSGGSIIVRKKCPSIVRLYYYVPISHNGSLIAYIDIELNGKIKTEFRIASYPKREITKLEYLFNLKKYGTLFSVSEMRYDPENLRFIRGEGSTEEEMQNGLTSYNTHNPVLYFKSGNVGSGWMAEMCSAGNIPALVIDNSREDDASISFTPCGSPVTVKKGVTLRNTISFMIEEMAPSGLPTAFDKIIKKIWKNNKDAFAEDIRNKLGNAQSDTEVLYYTQRRTNVLLTYAGVRNDLELLSELAEHFLITSQYLTNSNTYTYSYIRTESGELPGNCNEIPNCVAILDGGYIVVLESPEPYQTWIHKKNLLYGSYGIEFLLYNTQFVYVLAEALDIFLSITAGRRTDNINRFIDFFSDVIVSFYNRVVFEDDKLFQRVAWGCNTGHYNHFNFIQALHNLDFGKNNSYCNSVQDPDMWIIAGVARLLSINSKAPQLTRLSDSRIGEFKSYLSRASTLLNSRLSITELTNFNGDRVTGYDFLRGELDDYEWYDYSGYNDRFSIPPHEPKRRLDNVGWDISHASRFGYLFNALYENKNVTEQIFPSDEIMRGILNEHLYGVFNKNFDLPLFSNFTCGQNGWHRVEYSIDTNTLTRGMAPFDYSISGINSAYGLWTPFNREGIKRLYDSLWEMIKHNYIEDKTENKNLLVINSAIQSVAVDPTNSLGVELDGIQDFLSTPADSINPSEGSILFWIRIDRTGVQQYVLSNNIDDLSLYNSPDGNISLYHNGGSRANLGNFKPILREWYQMAVTYKKNGDCKLYLKGQNSDDVIINSGTCGSNDISFNGKKISLGAISSGTYNFQGAFDNFMIFNKTLSDDDIREIFSNGYAHQDGLIANWDFNEELDQATLQHMEEYYGDRDYSRGVKSSYKQKFDLLDSIDLLNFLAIYSLMIE